MSAVMRESNWPELSVSKKPSGWASRWLKTRFLRSFKQTLPDPGDLKGLQASEHEVRRAYTDVGDAGDGHYPHRLVQHEAVIYGISDQRRAGQRRAEASQQDDHGDSDAAPVRPQRRHHFPEKTWTGWFAPGRCADLTLRRLMPDASRPRFPSFPTRGHGGTGATGRRAVRGDPRPEPGPPRTARPGRPRRWWRAGAR